MAFASHAEYLKGIGHRTAALEDSRLLPLAEMGMTMDKCPELTPRAQDL